MNSPVVRGFLLLVLDIAGLVGAYHLAHRIRMNYWIPSGNEYLWYLVLVAIVSLYVMDAYRINYSQNPRGFTVDSLVAMIVVGIASVLLTYVIGVDQFTSIFGRGVLPVAIVSFSIWALACRWIIATVYHRSNAVARWLVLSSDEAFKQVSEQTRAVSPESKFSWLGLDSTSEDMLNWVRENAKQSGIIYESRLRQNSEAMNTLRKIASGNMTILSLTEYYEHFLLKLPVDSLENDWLGRSIGYNLLHDQVGIRLKRLIDLVFACTAFVITAPLMLLLACIIRVTSRGSVIYRQDRVGLHGTVFTLYKFRSMVEDAEKLGPQWSDVDDPRITRFGKFLRATRLDELPQLWNLIVGNMSLIGPRPERPEFVNDLKKQIPFYEMRELVPPGVTGWAQVMYRYGSSVDDARRKLEYDLYYINNHSIRLDITIVIKTLLVVVTGVGR